MLSKNQLKHHILPSSLLLLFAANSNYYHLLFIIISSPVQMYRKSYYTTPSISIGSSDVGIGVHNSGVNKIVKVLS